jgi:hypothetical protein
MSYAPGAIDRNPWLSIAALHYMSVSGIYIYSVALARKRTIPIERTPHVGEVSATFADRGCRVISATDPQGRILGFLDRSRYYFFQVVPQLYSQG